MYLFVHKNLKGSLTRYFRARFEGIHEKISCQTSLRAVNSDRDLTTLFCVLEEFLAVPTRASTGFRGRGDRGF
jgi:hypothetical protein